VSVSSNALPPQHLSRRRLREQVADAIQEMVLTEVVARGAQLPTERELARLFGVNRNTLREALGALEQRGLLRMKVGAGTFVTDTLPSSVVADSIERQFVFGGCSHGDLIAFREVLEPGIAAIAAVSATLDEMETLKSLVDRLEDAWARDDPDAQSDADMAFHETLTASTHNELMIVVYAGLQKVMRGWVLAQARTFHLEEGVRSHRLVLEQVLARNPAGARAAMEGHMLTTRQSHIRDSENAPPST
jgi:GntR family transcriptional regulator, transcriptional repressor for pyruvate dehydrogenase complex